MNQDQLLKELESTQKQLSDQKYALDQSAIVAITDKAGCITYVNEKFCEISKYPKEDLIGQTHSIINSGYHSGDFFKNMWQTIGDGKTWKGEIRNRAKDGSYYWVDTTIVPFLDGEGKPYQYIAIRYDITHRKKTEDELEDERQRLIQSEKMASLGVLSSGIAHELGNPLGAVRGRLEMALMSLEKAEIDRQKLSESITKMIDHIDRMSKIIRGLKSYARDGSHDPMEPFSLTNLVVDIVEISKEKCRRREIDIRLVGLDLDHQMVGREAEIGQVIVNLFNNACDALVETEGEKWVEVGIEELDGHISTHVKDSGTGIPEDVVKKMFDPFYTTKDVGKGTGLGLSICRSIIKNHGGELEYDSNSPNTCFRLTLPKGQTN